MQSNKYLICNPLIFRFQASALLSLSIMSAVVTASSAARLFLTLFSNNSGFVGFILPLAFQIGLTLLITIASLLIAVKQGRLMLAQSSSTSHSGISKFYLSVAMIINGGVIYGLSIAILQERWPNFSMLSLHFFGVIVSSIIAINDYSFDIKPFSDSIHYDSIQ